jgi:hypothetical protein
MKYKLVKISPNRNPRKWQVSFYEDDQDRKKEKTLPMAVGFYWYPAYMKDDVAFNKLKQRMILRHKKEIQLLQKSLRKLENLRS